MTRINVIPVSMLTDQHLMAEYRELPMVIAAARRSCPSKAIPGPTYTLNKGHVIFFYNKRKYLLSRWLDLIAELYSRGFNIDPTVRFVEWKILDKFPQVDWSPTPADVIVNKARIDERLAKRPGWYRFWGSPVC